MAVPGTQIEDTVPIPYIRPIKPIGLCKGIYPLNNSEFHWKSWDKDGRYMDGGYSNAEQSSALYFSISFKASGGI